MKNTYPLTYYAPAKAPLNYLYIDEQLVVVDKPSGLLSVPGKVAGGDDCLAARVAADHDGARIVHRLDMDTSGLMVLALDTDTHRALSKQFEMRQVAKEYSALVWGHVPDSNGTIDLPLRCDWPNRPRQMVDHEQGKPALTQWEIVTRGDNFTALKLTPQTGRSHQLRVHCLALGHPILGDNLYAHDDAYEASTRMCLHAAKLSFTHPMTKEKLCIEAPLQLEKELKIRTSA